MRIPQVSERVKEAPAHALRAVFAGIGQLLLVTDRLKNKPEEDQVPRPREPEPSGPAAQATVPAPAEAAAPAAPAAEAPAAVPPEKAPPAPEAPAPKPAGPTGNVRLLTDAEDAPAKTPAAETAAAGTPAAEPVAVTPPEGTPVVEAPAGAETPAAAAEPAAAAPAGAEPPIANYDQLSLASLRARLRGLTLVQVRELIVYEQANAGRPDVIAMYERRVAKLEAPEG